MAARGVHSPPFLRRGGCAINKKDPLPYGADGVVSEFQQNKVRSADIYKVRSADIYKVRSADIYKVRSADIYKVRSATFYWLLMLRPSVVKLSAPERELTPATTRTNRYRSE